MFSTHSNCFKQYSVESLMWENLSIYASIHDAIRVLLKELVSEELSDEIYHGQASVDPQAIIDRLSEGERFVSVFNAVDNELFRPGLDIAFEEMVQRQQ